MKKFYVNRIFAGSISLLNILEMYDGSFVLKGLFKERKISYEEIDFIKLSILSFRRNIEIYLKENDNPIIIHSLFS
ncbi:hypothetical protein JW968_00170 [Candidatus Woesearchaeota archaeon]|nr:hypothetical protein [Candidatus Woesearchaeota archaeon]